MDRRGGVPRARKHQPDCSCSVSPLGIQLFICDSSLWVWTSLTLSLDFPGLLSGRLWKPHLLRCEGAGRPGTAQPSQSPASAPAPGSVSAKLPPPTQLLPVIMSQSRSQYLIPSWPPRQSFFSFGPSPKSVDGRDTVPSYPLMADVCCTADPCCPHCPVTEGCVYNAPVTGESSRWPFSSPGAWSEGWGDTERMENTTIPCQGVLQTTGVLEVASHRAELVGGCMETAGLKQPH